MQGEKLLRDAVLLFTGYQLVVKPILGKLGVIKTDEQIKTELNIDSLKNMPAFNPNFFPTVGKSILLTGAKAVELSKVIYNAKGILKDDENAVIAAIRVCKSKAMISFLAFTFYHLYKKDLITYISQFFNQIQLKYLYEVVNALPDNIRPQ